MQNKTPNLKSKSVKMQFNTDDVKVQTDQQKACAIKARLESYQHQLIINKLLKEDLDVKLQKAAQRRYEQKNFKKLLNRDRS